MLRVAPKYRCLCTDGRRITNPHLSSTADRPMTSKFTFLVGIAACAFLVCGCDDGVTSKQAKARPPAATPSPALQAIREPLPYPASLPAVPELYDRRPNIDILVSKVQASFNTAEKEYKAGEFDKARTEYDRAVAMIVASGYQSDS